VESNHPCGGFFGLEIAGRNSRSLLRVTGFSAYFASLSPEMRQLVIDRVIAEK